MGPQTLEIVWVFLNFLRTWLRNVNFKNIKQEVACCQLKYKFLTSNMFLKWLWVVENIKGNGCKPALSLKEFLAPLEKKYKLGFIREHPVQIDF